MTYNLGHQKSYSRLSAAILVAISPALFAQQLPESQESKNELQERVSSFETITVTAQKKQEALSEVGATIGVVTDERLQTNGVRDVSDLSNFVPNLEIALPNGEGNQPAIFLRGIGTSDFNTNNNGPIAIYSDEVYKSSFVGQNLFMFDVDRVEVVKGPQGTLFGRNATGGAIRVISNKPTDEFELDALAEYARFGTTRFDVAVNTPLTDDTAFRFAAVKADSDGPYESLSFPKEYGGHDFTGWRAHLVSDVTDSLTLLVTAEGAHVRNPAAGYTFQGLLDPISGEPCDLVPIQGGECGDLFGYTGEPNRFGVNTNRKGFTDKNVLTYSLQLDYDLDDFTLTSISAYETASSLKKEDTDVTPLQVLAVDFGIESDTFSQELRLSYLGEFFDGVVGLFYLTEDLEQLQTVDAFRVFRPIAESMDPIAYPGGFDPSGETLGAPILFAQFDNLQVTDTYALFGQGDYYVNDNLNLVLGLRYTKEDRDFNTDVDFIEPTFTAGLYEKDLVADSENVSFKVGFEYTTEDSDLIYGSVSTGFKSGGFNGGFVLDEDGVFPFDEEKLLAYELGIKKEFYDANLLFNAAAFYYDYEDIQVFTFVNTGAGLPITVLTNAGVATIKGLEVDTVWKPMDNLEILASIGLIDSNFDEFRSSSALVDGDFTGNSLALSPDLSTSLNIEYTLPLQGGLEILISGDINYKSEVFFDPSNNPLYSQPGYTVVNANIMLKSDDNWSVAIFSNNLFDKEYNAYNIDFSSFGYNQLLLGEPRTFGVRASYSF
ncbi:TonB-dependent receptor [Ningiella sp. W23]|uniref:TonB-dependent receptor n=1 Tax=Ningiella sp. W23 TaxID=3023715 RepID=UPI0037563BAF